MAGLGGPRSTGRGRRGSSASRAVRLLFGPDRVAFRGRGRRGRCPDVSGDEARTLQDADIDPGVVPYGGRLRHAAGLWGRVPAFPIVQFPASLGNTRRDLKAVYRDAGRFWRFGPHRVFLDCGALGHGGDLETSNGAGSVDSGRNARGPRPSGSVARGFRRPRCLDRHKFRLKLQHLVDRDFPEAQFLVKFTAPFVEGCDLEGDAVGPLVPGPGLYVLE